MQTTVVVLLRGRFADHGKAKWLVQGARHNQCEKTWDIRPKRFICLYHGYRNLPLKNECLNTKFTLHYMLSLEHFPVQRILDDVLLQSVFAAIFSLIVNVAVTMFWFCVFPWSLNVSDLCFSSSSPWFVSVAVIMCQFCFFCWFVDTFVLYFSFVHLHDFWMLFSLSFSFVYPTDLWLCLIGSVLISWFGFLLIFDDGFYLSVLFCSSPWFLIVIVILFQFCSSRKSCQQTAETLVKRCWGQSSFVLPQFRQDITAAANRIKERKLSGRCALMNFFFFLVHIKSLLQEWELVERMC